MNTLDTARQGKSAARQIRSQMNAGVLTQAELDRLLRKVEAGYEELLPRSLPVLETHQPEGRGRFEVIRGDRL